MSNFERRRTRVDITSDGFLRVLEEIPKTDETKT
jgi:hypothetical protein